MDRDKKNIRKLRATGWRTLIVWECEARNQDKLGKKLQTFLGK